MGQDGAKMGQNGAKIGSRWANTGPRLTQEIPFRYHKIHSKNPRIFGVHGGDDQPSFNFAEACEAEAANQFVGGTAMWGSTPLAGSKDCRPCRDPKKKQGYDICSEVHGERIIIA